MNDATQTAAALSPAARKALRSIARNGRNCLGRKVLQGGAGYGCLVMWSGARRCYNLTGDGALVLRALAELEAAASTDLPTYTTTGGYVELRAPIDDETYEGRAVYAAAQRAAQAMADETQADVEIYAAEGYVMGVATPAEG